MILHDVLSSLLLSLLMFFFVVVALDVRGFSGESS